MEDMQKATTGLRGLFGTLSRRVCRHRMKIISGVTIVLALLVCSFLYFTDDMNIQSALKSNNQGYGLKHNHDHHRAKLTYTAGQKVNTIQNLNILKEYGIFFAKPKSPPSITKQQAIHYAIESPSYTRDIHNYKTIHVEYQLVSQPSFKVGEKSPLLNLPCFIVTFEGLHFKAGTHINTQFNIIINAKTGAEEMAFSYR